MRKIASMAVLVAAAAGSTAPAKAQSVEAGVEAWQRADYAAAVEIWRPLAESGDADAAFNLGQAYRLGRGVPINLAVAQTWLERAARDGHFDAQTTLGLLLFNTGNRSGGLRWLKSAAERGEPRALLIYGTALFNGDGIPRDPVLAYAYVSRAAAQGLAPAKATLAQMDEVLPLDQRKKAVAMAQDLAAAAKPKQAPAAKPPAKTRPPKAVVKAAPKPAPKAAPKRPAAAAATGEWRIQLGAFSKQASAEALYKRLAGNSAIAGRRSFLIPAGAVTRLQVGPFESRAAATAACRALSAQGQPCFAVRAN